MIKGFLFDVDGVLYDSMPLHARSWEDSFVEVVGAARPSRKIIYLSEGMPDPKAARKIARSLGVSISQENFKLIVKRKEEYFNSYSKPARINGASQLLKFLIKNKAKVGLVTGSYQLLTLNRIKKDFGISRNLIVTGKDVVRGKPYPDPYLQGLKKLQLKKSEVVVVENAPLGIRSAKRAGLLCVALKTGLISVKELKKCGADFVFKDCADLQKNLSTFKALDLLAK